MRAQSGILNLLTCLTLAATGAIVLVMALLFVLPGILPGFLRAPAQPVRVAIVTAPPTETAAPAYPTLPPEWTATPSPQPSATPTAGPTGTPTEIVTDTPIPTIFFASPTPVPVVTLGTGANIRSGPSTSYPVVGRAGANQTAVVLGRDSSAKWFAIKFDGAPQGIGWVSIVAATFDGDIGDLPVIQPASPSPQPTSVQPTARPAATNTPNVQGANGIQTNYFQMLDTSGVPYQHMRFKFQVVNTSGSTITYGILAAHTDQGPTADSWHDPLQPGQVLTWDDWIGFSSTGTYQVYLGICYASHDPCKSGSASWTRLSDFVTVTIH